MFLDILHMVSYYLLIYLQTLNATDKEIIGGRPGIKTLINASILFQLPPKI